MAATDVTRGRDDAQTGSQGLARRLTTETKSALKTTELYAYVVVLAGILIAGLLVDGDGSGADGGFSPVEAWKYATFLTIGYMVSRGLAKAGSRDPYTHEDDDRS